MLERQPGDPIWLLLTILAVWRVTAFLAHERGPLGMAVHARRAFVRAGLGRLAGCFYCLSVWTSCAAALMADARGGEDEL